MERTISWLTKHRSVRTRWAKKAENWLALIQLACAHILSTCSPPSDTISPPWCVRSARLPEVYPSQVVLRRAR